MEGGYNGTTCQDFDSVTEKSDMQTPVLTLLMAPGWLLSSKDPSLRRKTKQKQN